MQEQIQPTTAGETHLRLSASFKMQCGYLSYVTTLCGGFQHSKFGHIYVHISENDHFPPSRFRDKNNTAPKKIYYNVKRLWWLCSLRRKSEFSPRQTSAVCLEWISWNHRVDQKKRKKKNKWLKKKRSEMERDFRANLIKRFVITPFRHAVINTHTWKFVSICCEQQGKGTIRGFP